MSFANLELSQELLSSITRLGFTEPTKIQELSIPHILKGKDILGESATGSGKTLAFGCGIIEHVTPKQGIQALILTPTRELAEQIKEVLRELSYHKRLSIAAIYGGVNINAQITDLRRADVVVATPGRLLDHLDRGTIDTSKVKLLVLDEADRMLDMGFIEDVEHIIVNCPKERQTLFFSATLSTHIKELARQYMWEPVKVTATKMVDPTKLRQVYYDVPGNLKISLLIHLLKKDPDQLAMVFCNTRKTVDFVVGNLKNQGIKVIGIHGGFAQNKRIKTIENFSDGKAPIMVCTDVVARGLHVDNVTHVYNFDIPKDSKDYVHRAGRTARAGEEGQVINILGHQDHDNFSRVLQDYRDFDIIKEHRPHLNRIELVYTDDRNQSRHGPGHRGKQNYGHGRRF